MVWFCIWGFFWPQHKLQVLIVFFWVLKEKIWSETFHQKVIDGGAGLDKLSIWRYWKFPVINWFQNSGIEFIKYIHVSNLLFSCIFQFKIQIFRHHFALRSFFHFGIVLKQMPINSTTLTLVLVRSGTKLRENLLIWRANSRANWAFIQQMVFHKCSECAWKFLKIRMWEI